MLVVVIVLYLDKIVSGGFFLEGHNREISVNKGVGVETVVIRQEVVTLKQ